MQQAATATSAQEMMPTCEESIAAIGLRGLQERAASGLSASTSWAPESTPSLRAGSLTAWGSFHARQ